VYVLIR